MNYVPFVYLLKFLPTEQLYIGSRTAKNCQTSDLWTKYHSSSKYVKDLVKEYGKDAFEVGVMRTFQTREEAFLYEHRLLKKIDARNNTKVLNRTNGGVAFMRYGDDVINKRRTTLKKRNAEKRALGIHVGPTKDNMDKITASKKKNNDAKREAGLPIFSSETITKRADSLRNTNARKRKEGIDVGPSPETNIKMITNRNKTFKEKKEAGIEMIQRKVRNKQLVTRKRKNDAKREEGLQIRTDEMRSNMSNAQMATNDAKRLAGIPARSDVTISKQRETIRKTWAIKRLRSAINSWFIVVSSVSILQVQEFPLPV